MMSRRVISSRKIASFQKNILAWYAKNKRDLPWRKTTDPYTILVSEVMLQQTQVDRVIPKYEAFLKQFPTLDALGKAELSAVLRAWQGLGYNRRAKMLWELARHPESKYLLYRKITKTTPFDPEKLTFLPGIGHYTAAAVGAFAHNQDTVAFDTNLRRVHTRYFGKEEEAEDTESLAQRALPHGKARAWNNALMDFGSAVCTKTPSCAVCPLRRSCVAYTTKDFAIVVPKQKSFKESNRFYRGQILKALHDGAKTQSQLATIGDERKVDTALAQLVKEELIVKKNNTYTL